MSSQPSQMAKRTKEDDMSVKDVFDGKSILITGASGYALSTAVGSLQLEFLV